MIKMAECGVKDKVIVHTKTVSFVYDVRSESFTRATSLKIPKEEIRGSVGAGDAFCAGMLYAIHEEYPIEKALHFANASAKFNLGNATSTGGAPTIQQIQEFLNQNI